MVLAPPPPPPAYSDTGPRGLFSRPPLPFGALATGRNPPPPPPTHPKESPDRPLGPDPPTTFTSQKRVSRQLVGDLLERFEGMLLSVALLLCSGLSRPTLLSGRWADRSRVVLLEGPPEPDPVMKLVGTMLLGIEKTVEVAKVSTEKYINSGWQACAAPLSGGGGGPLTPRVRARVGKPAGHEERATWVHRHVLPNFDPAWAWSLHSRSSMMSPSPMWPCPSSFPHGRPAVCCPIETSCTASFHRLGSAQGSCCRRSAPTWSMCRGAPSSSLVELLNRQSWPPEALSLLLYLFCKGTTTSSPKQTQT